MHFLKSIIPMCTTQFGLGVYYTSYTYAWFADQFNLESRVEFKIPT